MENSNGGVFMDEQISVRLAVSEPEADEERVDELRRLLQEELTEAGIATTQVAESRSTPSGAKSAELLSIGAFAASLAPSFLPRLIELVQSWVTSGERRRSVHIKTAAGLDVEFVPEKNLSGPEMAHLVRQLSR
jgi:hypothetical protein